jgi:hypothetical protein
MTKEIKYIMNPDGTIDMTIAIRNSRRTKYSKAKDIQFDKDGNILIMGGITAGQFSNVPLIPAPQPRPVKKAPDKPVVKEKKTAWQNIKSSVQKTGKGIQEGFGQGEI